MGNGGITLTNPLAGSIPPSVAGGKKDIDNYGKSLSTGLKVNNDVVSSFLGASLSDKVTILNKILENIGYNNVVVKTSQDTLNSIAKILNDMLGLIASVGGDTNTVKTLDDLLQRKMEQLVQLVNSANFGGTKLVNGDLGADPTFRAKYNNFAVSARIVPPQPAGNTGFLGVGTTAVARISMDGTLTNGGVITIDGVPFKAVNGNADASKNEFSIDGANIGAAGMASSLASAIKNSTNEALQAYNVTDNGAVVTIARNSNTNASIPITGAPGALVEFGNRAVTIDVAGMVAGDTVTVPGGVVITTTAVGGVTNATHFAIGPAGGADPLACAANLKTAILATAANAAAYNVTIAGSIVTLVKKDTLNFTATGLVFGNGGGGAAPITELTGYINDVGIDLSGIKNNQDFIGTVATSFTLVDWAGGITARAKAASWGNALAKSGTVTNANDRAAVYSAVIGGKTFTGAFFYANATPNLNNAELRMENKDSGEWFTIKGDTAFDGTIDTNPNATALATRLTAFFNGIKFEQTKTLKINTDAGEITKTRDSVTTTIGSVKGMVASFTGATDFSDYKFQDFKIENAGTVAPADDKLDATGGAPSAGIKITAKISDVEYTTTFRTVSAAKLVKGFALDLTNAASGDVLEINIGEMGLATALSDATNYDIVASAIKAALTNSGSGIDVRTGVNFDNTFKLTIPSMAANKLFRNNNDVYIPKLSLVSADGTADNNSIKTAQEVVTNALAYVRKAQAKVQGEGEIINATSTSLSTAIAVTQEAASGYLDTDLVESVSKFAAALKSILAAISTLQAGARVADAGLEIIKAATQ